MFRVGDIEIRFVSDGRVMVDGGGPFGLVPRKLWSRYLQPDDENMIPMALNCLLVKVGEKHILVDTGMGSKLDEKMKKQWGLTHPRGTLMMGLARQGLTPLDIDIVIDTHLHADHAGGNTFFTPETGILPTFPKATYYVQRREYEDALKPNERTRSTYLAANFEPLQKSGQLHLLDGDTEIVPGIHGFVTPGHTPGHMSVVFQSKGQSAIFLCDMASYMVHFEKLAWMTAYDIEPMITLETKRRWQQWALETNALLFSAHDSEMPAARLTREAEGQLKVVSVPVKYD